MSKNINSKVALIDSKTMEPKYKIAGIVKRDLSDALAAYNFNKPYLRKPMVAQKAAAALKNIAALLDDIHEAFRIEHYSEYEVYESDFDIFRRLDLPYGNKYIQTYLKKYHNYKIDNMVKKRLVSTDADVMWLEPKLYAQEIVAVDLETTGLDPRTEKLVGVSMSWLDTTLPNKVIHGVYLPCGHEAPHDLFSKKEITQLAPEVILRIIQELVNRNIPIIVHNAAFDIKWLMHLGVNFPEEYKFHDTLLMIKCFDERVRAGLKETAIREYKYSMTKFEEVTKNKKFAEVDIKDALAYAGTDAVMTRLLFGWYKKQLQNYGTWDVYSDIEMPCVIPIAQMELTGCRVDEKHFEDMGSKISLHLKVIQAEIAKLTGLTMKTTEEIVKELDERATKQVKKATDLGEVDPDEEYVLSLNLSSTGQVAELLFERLKLQAKKLTEKNAPSTGTKALSLIKNDHPVVKKILEFRVAKKILDAYIKPLDRFINPVTGKIHTQIRQYGARSGRMSMSSPSLQVLPRSSEWDIRKGFIAGPGNIIIEADFCQMELMQAAAESQDPVMMEAFRAHRRRMIMLLDGVSEEDTLVKELKIKSDLHLLAAASALNKKPEEVTEDERTVVGKTLNFLIVYGGTCKGLAEILTSKGFTMDEFRAQELIDGYFSLFAGLHKWLVTKQDEARNTGRAVHASGRVVHNPKFRSSITEGGVRTLVNSLIQGQCASMFKLALPKVYWALKKEIGNPSVQLINVVHDAMYIVCPRDAVLVNKVLKILREKMEYEYKGLHFSVEQSVKSSMSKKDKVKIEGVRCV